MTRRLDPTAPPTDVIEALLREDRTIAATHASLMQTRHRIDTWLIPATDSRRRERDALRRKLAELDDRERDRLQLAARIARLENDVAAARGEVNALRSSRSWRITAPLRAVYRWLNRPSDSAHG